MLQVDITTEFVDMYLLCLQVKFAFVAPPLFPSHYETTHTLNCAPIAFSGSMSKRP